MHITYGIGDVVYTKSGSVEILNTKTKTLSNGKKTKYFEVRCNNDMFVYDVLPSNLYKGYGCPVCNNKIIVDGINSVNTTNKELLMYFLDKNDAKTVSVKSNKKINFVCPICGNNKKMSMCTLSTYGIGCLCGDGISYPNKFMYNVLKQIGVTFETEYHPKWANGRRYDFYIPSKNLIIEMDGGWHYKDNTMSGQTKEESKAIDSWKDNIAFENNVRVIRIDCRKSELEWIKNSIMNSELPKLLNFKEDDIDWCECEKFASSSMIKYVCDIWNDKEFDTTSEISKHLKLSKYTIIKYLKSGNSAGICNYDATFEMTKSNTNNAIKNGKKLSRAVLCVTTGEVFDSISDACKKYDLYSTNVSRCCNGRYSHTGKHPITMENLVWVYC